MTKDCGSADLENELRRLYFAGHKIIAVVPVKGYLGNGYEKGNPGPEIEVFSYRIVTIEPHER